jgi:GxxExxY protein
MTNELPEPFVDSEDEPDPELNRVTNAIIGAAIEVHRQLGPGLPESHYEEALAYEFELRRIPFERQVPVDVFYKNRKVGNFRADFVVQGAVLVEIKSVEAIAPLHPNQVVTYLRVTKLRLGLLINFNVAMLKDGLRRIAH